MHTADMSPNEMRHLRYRHSKVKTRCGADAMELAKSRELATTTMRPSSLSMAGRKRQVLNQDSDTKRREPQRAGQAPGPAFPISHFPGDLAAGVQSRHIPGTTGRGFAITPDWDLPLTNRL